ncbi:PREDICTED: uncharacterized protein LOC104817318 isoform X2 [Tarenaya hassleriana]|uniref:uncharacterized protein LOC104817318 isoform X2 n=1 Tax=Tarenaya hassleriana TaxID=28532 RepID=UPI00053C89BE|nr:PREDICTED: uncharacterized protein LOC104817318 isoform X2 [Tarenaya hassleriana]
MKGHRGQATSSSSCCNIHAKEIEVGVCPFCLNERLLLLLASQQQRERSPPPSSPESPTINGNQNLQESNSFKKKKHKRFFSFASSFLGFFESQHHNSHLHNIHGSVISPQDNGATSWDKGKVPTISLKHCKGSSRDHNNDTKETKKEMMIQHPNKSRASLRWRKRIGQLLHIIRIRGPSGCHVSSRVEGVDASSRWIRPSTKMTTLN